jgi:hypothetical protein
MLTHSVGRYSCLYDSSSLQLFGPTEPYASLKYSELGGGCPRACHSKERFAVLLICLSMVLIDGGGPGEGLVGWFVVEVCG